MSIQRKINEQIEGYAEGIKDAIVQNYLPGMGMSLHDVPEGEANQAFIDMLETLRGKIREVQREIGKEAHAAGQNVRYPS